MIQAVYVAFLSSLIGLKHFKNIDISFGLVKQIADNINIDWLPNDKLEFIASFLLATCLFLAFSLLRKYLIIAILSYHGWLYEARGKKISLPTRIWGLLVKLVLKPNAKIYEMQPYLPYLPLPSLNDTINRYLRSMRPLLDDEAYEKLKSDAYEFKNSQGFRFHCVLILKWLVTPNYVSDWWEKFAYLKSRSPLACSSNIYGLDTDRKKNYTKYPASRAANCTYALLSFRESTEKSAIKPITLQGNIPLCSYQYVRQFNTTRVPGEAMDKIVHLKHSNHVAVYANGKWFKMNVYNKGQLLNAKELEIQYEKILNDKSEPIGCEKYLASLTASNRTVWANARTKYFSDGINKQSLSAIEDAAFVVVFDDEDFESYNTAEERKLDNYSKAVLHGKANDRWFDKSFNLIISKNARVGANVEHTWADAPVTSHLWEYMLRDDHFIIGYDENGRSKGASRFQDLPEPAHLGWEFEAELESRVMSCYEQAREMVNDVDMHLYVHDLFGKNEFKRCKTSPDAFVQMALQLAYYNEFSDFVLTYESSMTRLFRYGRTETIRSCSVESCNWVKSMKDPNATKEERLRLFKQACEFHQIQCRDAMLGKGVDRHLFCLYIIANFLKQDSPFLNQVLSHPWRLSTSQTAPTQANLVDLKKYPDFIPLGGGFGPVNDEGYGVSYVFCTEDKITFHICSKKSCVKTDSLRFGQQIRESLIAIKNLFD